MALVKAKGTAAAAADPKKKTNLVSPTVGKSSIIDALKGIQSDFSQAEVQEYGDVPEGSYICQIRDVKVGFSKSENPRLQASWDLVIVEGEFANRHVFKHDGLQNAQNLGFMRTKIGRAHV